MADVRSPEGPAPSEEAADDYAAMALAALRDVHLYGNVPVRVASEVGRAINLLQCLVDVRGRAAVGEPAPERGCPCEWVTPCSDACSCANGYQSGGCTRCCKYGSGEQRLATAKHLAAVGERPAEDALRKYAQHLTGCRFYEPDEAEYPGCSCGFLAAIEALRVPPAGRDTPTGGDT